MAEYIIDRFYQAYDLILDKHAKTNYQSYSWYPSPLKIPPIKPKYFNFDCYGMFYSWIFRDKLEYIKNELMDIWKIESNHRSYPITKYGDILWFSYLTSNERQKSILKNNIFPSWNNHYRNSSIDFLNLYCKSLKNIDISNEKIKKGDIITWCNLFENKKKQKYGHIVIVLEEPKYIKHNVIIIKCGETTINKLNNGLQIKNRIFRKKDNDLFFQNKISIITRII